ncbi:MAG: GMC oxidoreductase [Candidatus Eisenbacteria bacterium]|nr:GMC oxidoreductase [Candidatus Eisenbacteria bacterium]
MPDSLLTHTATELTELAAERPFDCVIVGAGSSGLVAALTLSQTNPSLRLAILEAGPAPFLTHASNTELRYSRTLLQSVRDQVRYAPTLPDGTPFGPNYGCLGGRGLFWNGAAPRFRPHDFEGWPFSAADLADDYVWAEAEFRVTTRLGETALSARLIAALQRAGFAAEPGPFAVDVGTDGVGALAAGVASGLGVFFRCAGDAVSGGSIRIATRTYAERIDHNHGAVRGVFARTGDSTPSLIRARSVVLAAGGIESVRIAMLSGVPDPSGKLGFGLQEHHFYDCWFDAPEQFDPVRPDVAVVYVPSSSQDSEQWELHAPGRTLFQLDDGAPWAPAATDRYRIMVRSFSATDKAAGGRVVPRTGPPGAAVIEFPYTTADTERRAATLARAARMAGAVAGRPVGDLPVDDVRRFRVAGSSYHEAGGLDMGIDSATSVTDPSGSFHQLRTLVNMDAASFPRIGATNPHLTLIAVARRKARQLAAELR